MNENGIAIHVSNLEKVFNQEVRAVDSISFDVREGEIFGFLGPNGAGKTTTISILTTLMNPTSGSSTILGHDVKAKPSRVRELIGLVPQELTVDDELTGRENMDLQASLYHVPSREAEKKIDELLALVDLKDSERRFVKTYSGGMRKRLEIAQGLIHNPKILFLDEPTLGLDVQTRMSIWEHIRDLNKKNNMTIFLTTHYMDEADELCDRIAIIDHGKIVALDTPENLKRSVGGEVIEIEVAQCEGDILDMINRSEDAGIVDVITVDGRRCRIKVRDSDVALPAILSSLWNSDVTVSSVSISKPSLDLAFLEFTGRDLRDADARTSGGSFDRRIASMQMRRRR